MTTATRTRGHAKVADFGHGYTIVEDARWHGDPHEYLRYDLYNGDGEEIDSSDNLDLLSRYARTLAEEAAEEARADRASDLRSKLEELMWDCDDPEKLEAALKALVK